MLKGAGYTRLYLTSESCGGKKNFHGFGGSAGATSVPMGVTKKNLGIVFNRFS